MPCIHSLKWRLPLEPEKLTRAKHNTVKDHNAAAVALRMIANTVYIYI